MNGDLPTFEQTHADLLEAERLAWQVLEDYYEGRRLFSFWDPNALRKATKEWGVLASQLTVAKCFYELRRIRSQVNSA
jgi:hypothetical protein